MKEEHYHFLNRRLAAVAKRQERLTLEHRSEFIKELQSDETADSEESKGAGRMDGSQPWYAKSGTDISFETLLSIFLQIQKWHVRSTAHRHKSPAATAEYLNRIKNGASFAELGIEFNFPPFLLCHYVLGSLGRQRTKVSRYFKDFSLIPDPDVRAAAQEVCRKRSYFGPAADRARHDIGLEYEYILLQKLEALGIHYQTEDDLRREGRAKTPDVRLILPISVEAANGRRYTVNWIDSKAMFGDPHTHKENQKQLNGYVARYGPGMVIYWFDFVDTLNSDPHVLLARNLPSSFVATVD